MSWSYSKPQSNTGYIDGNVQISWINSWTITELTPDTAGKIRLQVELRTVEFWTYPSTYVAYASDDISCDGESVTIQSYRTAGYSYTKIIQVPSNWAGKTVTIRIAYATVTVPFTADPGGLVYIDSGASIEKYKILIDSGSSLDQYRAMVDTGSQIVPY